MAEIFSSSGIAAQAWQHLAIHTRHEEAENRARLEVVVGDAFWVDRTPELQQALERALKDPARVRWL